MLSAKHTGFEAVGSNVWQSIQNLKLRHYRRAAPLATGKEISYAVPVITSRLTSKAQTTIPQPVREALRLREGDELGYAIEEGRVILTKAAPGRAEDPFGTFSEWETEADAKAYARL